MQAAKKKVKPRPSAQQFDTKAAAGRVLKALKNDKFQYRTARGIAKEVSLPETVVEETLRSYPQQVRVSVMRRADGTRLFADSQKVSKAQDIWSALRAITAAKFK